jgi:hypothetical protein
MCHFDRSDAKHREVEKFIFKTDFSTRLDWASELILHYHYPDFNPVVCDFSHQLSANHNPLNMLQKTLDV